MIRARVAALLRAAADRLEPPPRILALARGSDLARRGPHPSLLARHPHLAEAIREVTDKGRC